MPRIAELKGGILIFMPTDDHGNPHFHVRCNGSSYKIFIDTLDIDKGSMPPKAFREVRTWARVRQQDLFQAWEDVRAGKKPSMIPPLP